MTETVERTFTFESVAWDDPRAVALRDRMDVELGGRYNTPGSPFPEAGRRALTVNPADVVATVLVLDPDGTAIAHGALRLLRDDWEVKRVIVAGEQRGRGVGRALMAELERIAREGQARRMVLQTGPRQPEAVSLYEALGYTPIPIYEPYFDVLPDSFCFEKPLG
jgi:GNAT superfamily N-acetyltransferase